MTNIDEEPAPGERTVPTTVVQTPRKKRSRILARRPVSFVLALAFFFGPAGAYAFGVRATEFENRPLRSFPGVSAGWDFFSEVSAWSTDHLPLRERAVRANVSMSEKIFGQPPSYGGSAGGPIDASAQKTPSTATGADGNSGSAQYPRVIQGTDDWLYFGGDMAVCQPVMSVPKVLAQLRRLQTAVVESGRTFVFTVAPDKSTVWPKNLPADYPGKDCAPARKAEFWAELEKNPPAGYIDMRTQIENRQQSGQPLYRPSDTHWGQFAAAMYAKRLAEMIDPNALQISCQPSAAQPKVPAECGAAGGGGSPAARSVDAQINCDGTASASGDLSVMLGSPKEDTIPACRIDAPATDITSASPVKPGSDVPGFGTTPSRISDKYAKATGLPGVRTPTLLLGDSFSNTSRPYLLPLFTNLTLMHNEVSRTSSNPPVVKAIVDSKVVAYEIVERSLASGNAALLDEDVLTAIEQALRAHPLPR